MGTYTAIYKCRLCGNKYTGCNTGSKDLAMVHAIYLAYGTPIDDPLSPSMNNMHYCENGSFGISDFQGFEYESESEVPEDDKT